MSKAIYHTTPSKNGVGKFILPKCCNKWIYTIKNNDMAYHGALCPICLTNGKQTVLYLAGTDEASEVVKKGEKNAG